MLISRGIPIVKSVCNVNARKSVGINLSQVRNVNLIYRSKCHPTKVEFWVTEFIVGVCYWWIAWNFYHDWDTFSKGHVPGPVPEIFSDEELGIPPEDN